MRPNFLIIGAPRCATTMMFENLGHHPDVFVPALKEPWYFLMEGKAGEPRGPIPIQAIRRWEDYLSMFAGAGKKKAVGEASPLYLYDPDAAEKIHRRLPDAKLIAILRQPARRAFSHFHKNRLGGIESLPAFDQALAAEEQRRRDGWFPFWAYREIGFYGKQIRRYLDRFDRGRMLFLLFDDVERDVDSAFRRVCRFLEVDDTRAPIFRERVNPAGRPRSSRMHRWLHTPQWWGPAVRAVFPARIRQAVVHRMMGWNVSPPEFSAEGFRRLTADYQEDILRTQELIRQDLSAWLPS